MKWWYSIPAPPPGIMGHFAQELKVSNQRGLLHTSNTKTAVYNFKKRSKGGMKEPSLTTDGMIASMQIFQDPLAD